MWDQPHDDEDEEDEGSLVVDKKNKQKKHFDETQFNRERKIIKWTCVVN